MKKHIEHLTAEEQDLLVHAPMYVSVLIAAADGDVKDVEKARILELVHIKSFSEHHGLQEIYQSLDVDTADALRKLIVSLPDETTERNNMLVDLLTGLNKIYPKLDYGFAAHYHKSLREFAHYVATADGGFWGVGSITAAEKEFVKLPFLQEPEERI